MSVSEKALEKRLPEAGKNPPPSVERLLQLLDELFLCLSEMDPDPPSSMQNALSPLMKALVATRLFEHSNVDVKVYVAACISQIMRITAPDAPYDDEKMKEVFQLILSSFEHLSDMYSCSYVKTISILDIVAKARVSLVMLDLGCDALLIEMFQHCLKALRSSSSMENIMTNVLEESDDIPPELLSPILHYVKKDDKVPQVSRRSAEQVLTNCASKLDTYLTEAVKSSGVSLDMYSNVVALICRIHEMVQLPVAEEEDYAEAETPTHKRPRVESCSLHEAHDEMETTTAAEGEHSCSNHKSIAETDDLQHKKLPQPCSVSDQLAKVKQSMVDTITSVRQFRSELETKEQSIVDTLTSVRQFWSEIKKKEDHLEDSLQAVDVLGM